MKMIDRERKKKDTGGEGAPRVRSTLHLRAESFESQCENTVELKKIVRRVRNTQHPAP